MISHTFKIDDAYRFAATHGLDTEAKAIREMNIHSNIRKPARVRKGCLIELFESRALIEQFIAQYWPGRLTNGGENIRTALLNEKLLNDRLLSGEPLDEDEDGSLPGERELPTPQELASFALEAQLRDFIAQNLSRITINERSVTLYRDGNGRNGVEYPTQVGPIDILAIDQSQNFVVFELKLERGPDRALGQLARYMGWIKTNLAKEREVFGVIVAKSIDHRLKYAVKVIPNVTLLEYELDFRLRDASSVLLVKE